MRAVRVMGKERRGLRSTRTRGGTLTLPLQLFCAGLVLLMASSMLCAAWRVQRLVLVQQGGVWWSRNIRLGPATSAGEPGASIFGRAQVRLRSSEAEDFDPVVKAKDVQIPLDKVDFQFARSSGPGGQNVNKLNTKAEMRFHVMSADWLAPEVRQRLVQYQANKISKDGELIVSSQEHRTQSKNKDDCIEKLKVMVAEAMLTPKQREMWVGLGEKGKAMRKQEKRKRGDIKEGRRKNFKDFD